MTCFLVQLSTDFRNRAGLCTPPGESALSLWSSEVAPWGTYVLILIRVHPQSGATEGESVAFVGVASLPHHLGGWRTRWLGSYPRSWPPGGPLPWPCHMVGDPRGPTPRGPHIKAITHTTHNIDCNGYKTLENLISETVFVGGNQISKVF